MHPPRAVCFRRFDSRPNSRHTLPMDLEPPPTGILAEDWAATPLAVRHFLSALLTVVSLQQQQIAHLQQENADLRQRVTQLEARLNQHSQNSSKPPSSDPPSAPPRP